MIWLIIIVIYLLSVFVDWLYIHIDYSKNGEWEGLDTDFTDLFFIFCPIINTVFAFFWIIEPPRKYPFNTNKFFKIKK